MPKISSKLGTYNMSLCLLNLQASIGYSTSKDLNPWSLLTFWRGQVQQTVVRMTGKDDPTLGIKIQSASPIKAGPTEKGSFFSSPSIGTGYRYTYSILILDSFFGNSIRLDLAAQIAPFDLPKLGHKIDQRQQQI